MLELVQEKQLCVLSYHPKKAENARKYEYFHIGASK